MKILLYPNTSLVTKCAPITDFNSDLHATLNLMDVVMRTAAGLGLAANQLGLNKGMFIIKDAKGVTHEFLNPSIKESSGSILLSEGCLSAPGLFFQIIRPEHVQVSYQDREGNPKEIVATGMEARTILHEYEHLQGEFYFKHLSNTKRRIAMGKLKRMK